MGTLVAMHYPTKLFANAADHTYVKCGTGRKAWGCWGGKVGGAPLHTGQGSTNQADAIAEPDERAGITCYLINGVCHQAANRILFSAGITVASARGYGVSEALFGPYGRPRGPLGSCLSPFDRHTTIAGDLTECADTGMGEEMLSAIEPQSANEQRRAKQYIKDVVAIYDRARLKSGMALLAPELEGFSLELFMLKVQYNLGSGLDKMMSDRLRTIRLSTERSRMKIEALFSDKNMEPSEFVQALNNETLIFQDKIADALGTLQYRALFDLDRDERIVLADPSIVEDVYGNKPEPDHAYPVS